MKILGIETSCDETAAAVVQDGSDPSLRILSNIIFSQVQEHLPYGGVVPEVAARAHLYSLSPLIRQSLEQAGLDTGSLDAIASTGGPGLIGGVAVGVTMGKAMAMALNIPFLPINHLEGHALTPRLSHNVQFPYLLLLVSGGHCQFLEVLGGGQYQLLGRTLDDAVGEAFDKVAKMMNLEYPGGPALEIEAKKGDPLRFSFPLPLQGRSGCDFSFSGLKTAVRSLIEKIFPLSCQDRADVAASFQKAVSDCLVHKTQCAFQMANFPLERFVIAGGVAANQEIRNRLGLLCEAKGVQFIAPPPLLCTDNAAMIAWVGIERLREGSGNIGGDLFFSPRPRWPLCDPF